MKSILYSSIKKLDFMSQSVNLKIKGKDNLKTFSGGLLCLLIIIFMGGIVAYYLNEYIAKSNPIVTSITQMRSISQKEVIPVKFLETTVLISYASEQSFKFVPLKIIDKKMNLIKVFPLEVEKNKRTVEKAGDVITCAEMDYLTEIRELYTDFNYTNCVAYKYNNSTIVLSDDIKENLKLTSSFTTDLCEMFDKSKCGNLTYLGEYFEKGNFILTSIFSQTLPNMYDKSGYTNSYYMTTKNIDLSLDYMLKITITKHTILTKVNGFFNFINEEKSVIYSINTNPIPIPRNKKSNLLTIYSHYELDDYEYFYIRSYHKLDDICANVISIYYLARMFVKGFLMIFNYGYLHYKIGKNIYWLEEGKDDDNINCIIRIKNNLSVINTVNNNNKKSLVNNINDSVNPIREIPIRLNLNKREKEFTNNTKPPNPTISPIRESNKIYYNTLNNSSIDKKEFNNFLKDKCKKLKYTHKMFFIKYFCKCCLNPKNYKNTHNNLLISNIINRELDVRRFLTMFIEVENFRKIFLDYDEEKLKCLRIFASRRFINTNRDKLELQKISFKHNFSENEDKILQFLNEVTNSNEIIDKKIMSLILN